jgi:hypothetical protein
VYPCTWRHTCICIKAYTYIRKYIYHATKVCKRRLKEMGSNETGSASPRPSAVGGTAGENRGDGDDQESSGKYTYIYIERFCIIYVKTFLLICIHI